MFISDTHLPQLLTAEHYRSEEQLAAEVDQLFMPGWHCLAVLPELEDPGYRAMQFAGHPILVHRDGQRVQAYRNVCGNKNCDLRTSRHGRKKPLVCPRHGVDYADPETHRLTALPTETLGQLVFVSLGESQSLRDYLGQAYELCKKLYSTDAELVLSAVRPNRSNWKVSLENSLEGYHLETVHAETFRMYPPDSHCEHALDEGWSSLRVEAQGERSHLEKLGDRLFQLAGAELDSTYHQQHVYPNLVFAKFGMFSWVEVVSPDSATDSHDLWWFFSNIRRPGCWRTYLPALALKAWGKQWFAKVIKEDEDVFPAIQGGLDSPDQPGVGLVSIREERVFHFQRYLADRVGVLPTVPASQMTPAAAAAT